mgnify:CR=1 FL=1
MSQQSGDGTSSGNLVSDVTNEIQVTLDQWSVGQLGVQELIAAAVVIALGSLGGWLASRLLRRAASQTTGAARAAVGTIGKLVGGSVTMLSIAAALEILGFNLGPALIVVVIGALAVFLMRPLLTNLSSGLVLQVRKALDLGDLVRTTEDVLGVVQEINARTVVIDTVDGRRVHVPSSQVLENAIVNYSSLGRRRSAFEVLVRCDEDLESVVSTMSVALSRVDAILTDPAPEVQVSRLVGRLVAIRTLIWHPPEFSAERAAVDAGIRAVLAGLRAAGLEPDGPTLLELASDRTPAPVAAELRPEAGDPPFASG